MKWTKSIAFSLILLQISCKNTSQSKGGTPQYLAENTKPSLKIYSELELTNLWDSLCNIHDCLTGGQRVNEGKWGGEGCVLTLDKRWVNFLSKTDKKQLSSFLIKQLPDKAESQIHTCPYDDATRGELALYCLQGISKINFYELSPAFALKEKEVGKNTAVNKLGFGIFKIQKRNRKICKDCGLSILKRIKSFPKKKMSKLLTARTFFITR